jgi:pyridoxamine 5'-phosphate oxidase
MEKANPIEQFALLFAQAEKACPSDYNAMVLSTISAEGRPSSRVVLLKGFGHDGFVFYTNLGSRKAEQLRASPYAALCFYWRELGKQVRIEGEVAQVSDAEADAYFATRPRLSQIGAWASRQSSRLASRDELLANVAKYEEKFSGRPVARPPFWSGFQLRPTAIEIWTNGENRLHHREQYVKEGDGWRYEMLYP